MGCAVALLGFFTLKGGNSDLTPTQLRFWSFQRLFVPLPTLKYAWLAARAFLRPLKLFFNMAKGNMLLGHARGKVGDLVFSRTNGQQVTRARAAVVKNPQSQAQMVQRIILNTVAQAYSRMSAITDHSFEGVQQGQKSMSVFMRTNINELRARVAAASSLYNVYAFTPIGQNILAINAFEIAKGSLPMVVPTIPTVEATGLAQPTLALATNTYQGVLDQFGLQRGDQLTFIEVSEQDENSYFNFVRVILDPTVNGESAPLSTAFIEDGAIKAPSARNEGTFKSLAFANGAITFGVNTSQTGGQNAPQAVACAVIVSRQKADGEWLRSNSTLVISADALESYAYSMGEALDLFESGGISMASDVYLNNAGRGRLLSSSEGEVNPDPVTVTVGGNAVALGSAVTIESLPTAVVVNVPEDSDFLGENYVFNWLKDGAAGNSFARVNAGENSFNLTDGVAGGSLSDGDTITVGIFNGFTSTTPLLKLFDVTYEEPATPGGGGD